MSQVNRGVLRVTMRKKVPSFQLEVGFLKFTVSESQFAPNARADVSKMDGAEVQFDWDATKLPVNIRKGDAEAPRSGPRQGSSQARNDEPDRFHNPYNFVPAPPRNTSDPDLGDLGDSGPPAQDRFLAGRYSGRVRVRMVTGSPLLIMESEPVRESTDGHGFYQVRTDERGFPLIPASSVRGMLRSAYEAITNSRFGKFSDTHGAKLQYRDERPPRRKVYHNASPRDLLPPSLRPAAAVRELSPADRVFGWVRGAAAHDSPAAYRGLLRVGPIRCLETSKDSAVKTFPEPGVPLAVLAAPKPQQARFYVARNPDGDAQAKGLDRRAAGYSAGKGLRGRKFYPHHRGLPSGHWQDPMEDRTQKAPDRTGRYQEYRRPNNDGKERDNQNRSILGWIPEDTRFEFDLELTNLSKVEAGALLWMLSLGEKHFLRLGFGRPLGFGSVRLEIVDLDLRTPHGLRSSYMAWDRPEGDTSLAPAPEPSASTNEPQAILRCDSAIAAFKEGVVRAYGGGKIKDADQVSFIRAFLVACQGFQDGLPIHYPRAGAGVRRTGPPPAGEQFRWFTANDKQPNRWSLPDLGSASGSRGASGTTPQGLPQLDVE